MTVINLFDQLGRPLTLGTELGKGGEGSVFDVVNFPDLVAKVYHQVPPSHQEAKLRAMIGLARKELCDIAAWPTTTLHERPGGPVCGLVMRKIKDFKEIHFLYSPAHRKVTFPQADWRFLAHVAMNCAAAFDTMHSCGIVIGDVNQSNVFVSAQGLVVLIDCDSYQVQQNNQLYPCEVGIDLFTPPELQGRSFRGVIRTPNHDRFGLAVLIFYLLFMNRHPFAGRYLGTGEMPINQAIAQHRFAFSRLARTYQMQTPMHAPSLSILPSQLVDLFELAFGSGSIQSNGRPTAAQWVVALKTFLGTLRSCTSDTGHVYAPHLSNCPWCSLMQQGAPNFFVTVAITRGGTPPGGAVFVLSVVWARIEQVPRPNTSYVRPAIPPAGNPTPWPAKLGRMFPAKPITPSILTSPHAPPPAVLGVGQTLPPEPLAPTILTSPPAPPVINVGSPKSQKMLLQKDSIQMAVGISSLVCGVGFIPLCLGACLLEIVGWRGTAVVLAIFSVGSLLVFISSGVWWLILEGIRLKKEQELNQQYDEEVVQLKAKARKQRDLWIKQLEATQAEARKRFENEIARWKESVATIKAEVRRQRELWERQLELQQAEARSRLAEEMTRWTWAVAAMKEEAQRRRQGVEEARRRLDAAEKNWKAVATKFLNDFDKKKRDLQGLRERHNRLTVEYAAERQQLQARAREMQLQQFLQLTFIPDNGISKIGPGRAATLASFGIETALDIVEDQILNVPGFGPGLTRRLVEWRRIVESKFVFNAAAGIPPHELQTLDSKYGKDRLPIEAVLLSGERDLRAIVTNSENQLKQLYEHIKSSLIQLDQANADISVIPPGV